MISFAFFSSSQLLSFFNAANQATQFDGDLGSQQVLRIVEIADVVPMQLAGRPEATKEAPYEPNNKSKNHSNGTQP